MSAAGRQMRSRWQMARMPTLCNMHMLTRTRTHEMLPRAVLM